MTKGGAFVALAGVALICTPGCFSPGSDEDGRAGVVAPIVNGSLETGFPSVVGMGAESGEHVICVCTGSLITPQIVLSAGHCGTDIPPELLLEEGLAFFGPETSDYELALGFVDHQTHPEYDLGGFLDTPRFDLGVFVLEQSVEVEPIRLRHEPITDDVLGRELLAVGYGVTGPDVDDTGTRRSATLVVAEYTDQHLVSHAIDHPDGGRICSGDSGGPLLDQQQDGRWHQVSVHSYADVGCENDSGSTRIDIAFDWILARVGEVHGTTDLCEVNDRYGDGHCDEFCDLEDPDCAPVGDDDDDTAIEGPVDDGIEACECAQSTAPGQFGRAAAWLALALLIRRRVRRPGSGRRP